MSRVKVALVVGVVAALIPGTIAIGANVFESQGQQFHYVGPATDAVDPQNSGADNDVARFDTTSGAPVAMARKMKERVRDLDNQLEFKYFMQNRNCGAGSPRIDLGLDTNGDGSADAFLEGHVQPNFVCPNQNEWVFQDLTDQLPRWASRGLTGGPGNTFVPWETLEQTFGDVPVVFGQLVEDSQAFKPDNRGIAFYDSVQLGNQDFEDHNDSANSGSAPTP